MTVPFRATPPLESSELARLRRRAIFECCKWDPQVEDTTTIGSFALVLGADDWRELTSLAESLARETLAAEAELATRPELNRMLALPRSVARVLARRDCAPTPGIARLIRFDFHHTPDGWRISEANTDVPGGLNEASGLAELMAPHFPGTVPAGDTAGIYCAAILATLPDAPRIALAHATAYTDDRQVMHYVASRLAERGARTSLVSPAHLRWNDGRARVDAEWARGALDAVVRFFPGEWLPNLPKRCGWSNFFGGGATPVSNPGSALLTQSKRFPLVWDSLRTSLPAWRAMLPETRDPREIDGDRDGWVLKPALGRVGEDVGIPGVTESTAWKAITRRASWFPRHWIAQRRFAPTPLLVEGETFHPCIGVYTVGDRVAGAYGRLARRPLIDWRATDVAVLVERESAATSARPVAGSVSRDQLLERSA